MYFVIVPLVFIIAVILGLAVHMRRQSGIEPAPYEVMFEHRESEPLRVGRADGSWVVTAAEGVLPMALRSGMSFDDLGESIPLVPVASWYEGAVATLPSGRQFFEITLAGGQTVRSAERVVPLEGAANFRDVGGYETSDGRRVAWGRVFRSDELYSLTEPDLAAIHDLGIQQIVDLRSPPEVARRPDQVPLGVGYRHWPVFTKDPIGRVSMLFIRDRLDARLERMYRVSILDEGAPVLGDVLRLVTDPANLPLLYHCTGGKDRTGILSALLLHICGVPRDVIVADYSLTNLAAAHSLASIREAFHATKMPAGVRLEQYYPLFSARPEIIERAFARIEAKYGSLDDYLRAPLGLTADDLLAIRENLVT